jgi:DNA-binding IclR family transcriptional regulator
VLYIYAIEAPQRLLARTAIGEHAHYHSTSIGKAILSRLPDEQVEEIISRVGLPKLTETTITDANSLRKELLSYQENGFSIDNSENEQNTYCIGAPILNDKGQVIAACSISNLDANTLGSNLPELSASLLSKAQEISRRMGYVPVRRPTVLNSMKIKQK